MTTQNTETKRSAYIQPLEVVKSVKDDYLGYLLTTFPVSGVL